MITGGTPIYMKPWTRPCHLGCPFVQELNVELDRYRDKEAKWSAVASSREGTAGTAPKVVPPKKGTVPEMWVMLKCWTHDLMMISRRFLLKFVATNGLINFTGISWDLLVRPSKGSCLGAPTNRGPGGLGPVDSGDFWDISKRSWVRGKNNKIRMRNNDMLKVILVHINPYGASV